MSSGIAGTVPAASRDAPTASATLSDHLENHSRCGAWVWDGQGQSDLRGILPNRQRPVRAILRRWRITSSFWMGWPPSWWTSRPRAAIDPCVDFRLKRQH